MKLKTTECDKLGNESRSILQFLEWLSSIGLGIGENREIIYTRDLYNDRQRPFVRTGTEKYTVIEYLPALRNHQDIVYEYLGINAAELENERRTMIEEVIKKGTPNK